MSKAPIHVAVAIIEDDRGRVLISRRQDHQHQGGLWEFPGGKLEPGETVAQALQREIHEELGLQVQRHRPLIRLLHHYPDRSVLLDVHRVTKHSGTAEGLEGQDLAWSLPDRLQDYALLPADRPIVTALQLPDRYLITPEPVDIPRFLYQLEKSLEMGNSLVQLRAKSLSDNALRSLAIKVKQLCGRYGARLLINGAIGLAEELDADGVHLTSTQLMALGQRPLGSNRLVAASCHSAQELAQAQRLGLDFVVLSPVLQTSSHPKANPLGWEVFAEMVDPVSVPVYALGGLSADKVDQACGYGAQGISGISGLWCNA